MCDLQQLLLQACIVKRVYILPGSCGTLAVMLAAVVIMGFMMCLFPFLSRYRYFKLPGILGYLLPFSYSTSYLGIVLRQNYSLAIFSVYRLWHCIKSCRKVCY